jgi:hypothetical protein
MGQKSNDAAEKDVQIDLTQEEYASGMEQRSSYAVVKVAQIKLRKEDCAWGMEQRGKTTYAALKVAQT